MVSALGREFFRKFAGLCLGIDLTVVVRPVEAALFGGQNNEAIL
jgi:hypothetical protein